MPKSEFLKAARLFGAAFAALLLAHALGLTNPYWAAMPIWVVIRPYRQDMLIRGALRVLGTVIGAGIGFLIIQYVHLSVLVGAGLVVMAAASVGLAFWIGSIYAYGAMIAGMTCAVIVIPAIGADTDASALAIDRFWCTLIGVLAVTLSAILFVPNRQEKVAFRLKTTGWAVFGRMLATATLLVIAFLVVLFQPGFIGISFAMGLSIFSIVLGSFPDPAPLIRNMPKGALVGVTMGLVYRYIGGVSGFDEFQMVLFAGAFIAVGAVLYAHPQTAPFGLDANMLFLLSAEVGLPGHSLDLLALAGGAAFLAALLATTAFRLVLAIPVFRPRP